MKKSFKDYLLKLTIYAVIFTAFENIAERMKIMRKLGTKALISNFIGFLIADILFDKFIREKNEK